jgi:hypothetical protein
MNTKVKGEMKMVMTRIAMCAGVALLLAFHGAGQAGAAPAEAGVTAAGLPELAAGRGVLFATGSVPGPRDYTVRGGTVIDVADLNRGALKLHANTLKQKVVCYLER